MWLNVHLIWAQIDAPTNAQLFTLMLLEHQFVIQAQDLQPIHTLRFDFVADSLGFGGYFRRSGLASQASQPVTASDY